MQSAAPAVSIVLPTYNEAESLKRIIPRIAETLREAQIACEIVVVDDDSPDGTADVALALAADYPVEVIRRTEERGLATAVLAGFAKARAPVCVVMDADGSHPVAALPGMVRAIADDKADVVVGSRYIKGGGSHNWPLFSQFKSKLAASLTFGLTSMTDPTTGLMAVRKSLLHGLELDPVGWKIVLEVVVKAAPVRVAEVPIVFEDRELGESKQSLKVFAEYALHVSKLYAHRYPGLTELIKFCVVGLIGLCLDLATVMTVKELTGLDTRVCAIFGFAVAVSTNYLFNRYFTFARGRELPLLWSYLTYVGTNLLGLSVRMSVVHALMVLTQLDKGHGYLISNAMGIAAATLFNFVGAKYFAFAPERLAPGAPREKAEMMAETALPVSIRRATAALVAVAVVYTLASSQHVAATFFLWTALGFTALLPFRASPRAGIYSTLLLATSPGLFAQALTEGTEPAVLTLCSAGLYLTVEGTRRRQRGLCLAGGALLGFGSLGGAWLAIPYALASCAFVLVQTTLGRAREEQPLSLRRSVLAGVLGFALAAGARLWISTTTLANAEVAHVFGNTDLHILGVAGGSRRPPWFYLSALYRDHFYLLPLCLFGLPALLRRTRPHAIIALAMAFAVCLGLVLLSWTGVTESRYLLAVLPFLYVLAGTSLAELDIDANTYRPANVMTVQTVASLAMVGSGMLWLTRLSGSSWVTTRYALVHGVGMLACALVGLLWTTRRQLALGLLAGGGLVLLSTMVTR